MKTKNVYIVVFAVLALFFAGCDVFSNNVAVTGVSLDTTSLSLDVGGSRILTPNVEPANATNRFVSWSSSNPAIAAVSAAGVVTALAEGTATITVTTRDGGRTANVNVTVNPAAIAVTGVSLPASINLIVGEALTLTPTITPSNATNQNLSWSSSNSGIAAVSADGLVTAVAAGTAAITVSTADGGKTASSNVTVGLTPLQKAINWANEDARRWACSWCCSNAGIKHPFRGNFTGFNYSVDEMIRGSTTFIQFVENALTKAWNTTYQHNPSVWNAAKWKEVINGAFTRQVGVDDTGTPIWYPYPHNHNFCDLVELPLIIS